MASPLRIRFRQRQDAPAHPATEHARARPRRLRRPERALAEALDQLGAGVPLNWSQLEDDPELATLSALQPTATEGREIGRQLPAALRSTLLEQLSAQLPTPRPEPQPVKEAPKSPAGFTGKVYVPAQAEENVPRLTSTALPWVASGVLVLALVIWGAATFSGPGRGNLSFSWIEVRQSGRTVSNVNRPAGWKPLQCASTDNTNNEAGSESRTFLTLPDPGQIEATAGPIADFLPGRLSSPVTYTLRLLDGAVSPCADTVPDPADPGTILKLSYVSSSRRNGEEYNITPFTVFQFKGQPFQLDTDTGAWEQVSVGDWHGVYWRGAAYRDMEGTNWTDDVSVLAVERGDSVMVIVGQNRQGITKEMLVGVLDQMERSRTGRVEGPIPSFKWVELVKGEEVLSSRQLPPNQQTVECAPNTNPRSFRRFFTRYSERSVAESYVGFPVVALPLEGRGVVSYTVRWMQPSVGPCASGPPTPEDPLAMIKLGYAVNLASEYDPSDVRFTLFESNSRPITFNVGSGYWEELRDGDAHMLYWTGNPYRDPEGIEWNMNTNVLLVEKGDYTLILTGFEDTGASREVLLELAGLLE